MNTRMEAGRGNAKGHYPCGEGLYWCRLPNGGKERYITGGAALNLDDPASGTEGAAADWHGKASWISPDPRRVVEHISSGGRLRTPWEYIHEEGIQAGKNAVLTLGHPEATEVEEIWVASHTRAILDIGYTRWTGWVGSRRMPIGRAQVSDWIWTVEQMDELKGWIEGSAFLIPGERRDTWKRWGDSLRFGASHEDYEANDNRRGIRWCR